MNKMIVIRLGWSPRKRGKRAQKAVFYSSLNARNVPRALIDCHTEQFWGSLFGSKMWKKKWKRYFFWKSAAIAAFFEKNTKMPKSPHWRVFLVLRKPKKLGQRSLKRWILVVFYVFENESQFLSRSRQIGCPLRHCSVNVKNFTYSLPSAPTICANNRQNLARLRKIQGAKKFQKLKNK